jgi:hypothetical protein
MMPLLSFALYAYLLRQVIRALRWWVRQRNRRRDPLYGRGFDHIDTSGMDEPAPGVWTSPWRVRRVGDLFVVDSVDGEVYTSDDGGHTWAKERAHG